MSDPFLGEIRLFPYNFTPVGWSPCDGRLLSIAENSALFSLLGNTYGGDGKVTFARSQTCAGALRCRRGRAPA
jgi:microcystin-dependent protein